MELADLGEQPSEHVGWQRALAGRNGADRRDQVADARLAAAEHSPDTRLDRGKQCPIVQARSQQGDRGSAVSAQRPDGTTPSPPECVRVDPDAPDQPAEVPALGAGAARRGRDVAAGLAQQPAQVALIEAAHLPPPRLAERAEKFARGRRSGHSRWRRRSPRARRLDPRRKVKHAVAAEQHRAVHRVLQLAHIARPAIGEKLVAVLVPQRRRRSPMHAREAGEERLADRVSKHITKALVDRRSDKWSRLQNRWNNTMRATHADQFGYELPKNPDDISFVVDVRVVTSKAPSATAQQAVKAAVTAWLKKNERGASPLHLADQLRG